MKKYPAMIYEIGLQTIKWLSVILTFVLFVSTLIYSYYEEEIGTFLIAQHKDNLILSIVGLGVWFLFLFAVIRLTRKNSKLWKKVFLVGSILWTFVLGLILIIYGKSIPTADQVIIYRLAELYANNDFGSIVPKGSYISFYPQQFGIIGYYELLFRIVKLLSLQIPVYQVIQVLNVFFACLVVYFQQKITHLLFESEKVDILYLILMMANLPFLLYTSYVYGEIPSFALLSAGIYFFLKFMKKAQQSYWDFLLSLLFLVLSVGIRKNTIIMIIGILIVVFFECLKNFSKKIALFGVLLLFGAVSILPGIQKSYEIRSGGTVSKGVPAITYVAMGMQESIKGSGWYNGFNYNTFEAFDMDTEATVAFSKDAISQRIDELKQDKVYALSFYKNKFLTQWTDGSYYSRQATAMHDEGRSALVENIYNGDFRLVFLEFCNVYQVLIFGTGFLCMFHFSRKRNQAKSSIILYVGLIALWGGFLFHFLWEANSRYVFPFTLLLLPYCAKGIEVVLDKIECSKN